VQWLAASAADHGWQLLFADRHPLAGGPDHHTAYLANSDGYEVELVARPGPLEPAAGSPDPVNPPEPPQ
jgi:hypothetical protein